ncbi:7204_t:CDS:1, partial [Funneliformis geosporum]
MSPKHYTFIINTFIILVILSTSINSNSFIERDVIDYNACQGESCCAYIAKKIANKNHERVATIVIVNKSGYNITPLPVKLEKGRFVTHDDHENIDINCEPQTEPLTNGQNETFSSIASHFLGELKGIATFIIDDGSSSAFTLYWSASMIGTPPHYEIDGLPNTKYYNESKLDLEDTLFQVTIHRHNVKSVERV